MKNIVIPILGAVSIVSTGAVAWLLATPPSVDPRVVKLESELKEARQAINNLKSELARKPAALPLASSTPAPEPNPTLENPLTVAPGDKQDLQQMFSSPAVRTMIDQQQAAQIEVGYAQLFEHLQLTPEEREHFKKLLTARQKTQTDLSLKLLEPNLSEAKRQELVTQAKREVATYDASIRNFLNDENDFRTYSQWENTRPERTQFDTVGRGLFTASGSPLSTDQEQQLINLMAEVRSSPYSVGGLNDQTGTNPNKLTDEVIALQMQQLDANSQVISERAAAFLSPPQRQTLKTYLEQMKTMSKSGIEMTKMILRGANK